MTTHGEPKAGEFRRLGGMGLMKGFKCSSRDFIFYKKKNKTKIGNLTKARKYISLFSLINSKYSLKYYTLCI